LEKEEDNMNLFSHAAAAALSFFVAMPQALAQAPIKIGMTLSLTRPIAAPGAIQKVATETYVEDLNRRGGLLGR
jgi:branched-chain amino acid transport system substrate-binding protein